MRINARLDDDRAEKLRQLQTSTAARYRRDRQARHRPVAPDSRRNDPGRKIDDLLSSDFVGCAEGPEDLAENLDKHGAG